MTRTHPLRPWVLTGAVVLATALGILLWLRPASTTDDRSAGTLATPTDAAVESGFAKSAAEPASGAEAPTSSGALAPDIVVTAAQEVIVTDVPAAVRTLTSAVAAAGGHLSNESTTSGIDCRPGIPVDSQACSQGPSSILTYRVPADQVSPVMDAAAAAGEESWRTRNASDVSTQVADIDARVHSAQASLDRLNALMIRAEDLNDVVALEAQISARQAELESLQAQQRVLADQTALATVTTSFRTAAAAGQSGPAAAFRDGLAAVGAALMSAVTTIAWLLPFVVLFAAAALPLGWAVKRRRARHADRTAPDQQGFTAEVREPTELSQ